MSKKITVECTKNMNSEEERQVLFINNENLFTNGGQLHYKGILQNKYAVLAKIGKRVVGYALLMPDFLFNNDLYVMQVAVNKNYQHTGIGSKIYKYIFDHIKGCKIITASVNENNLVSKQFHQKMGFTECGKNSLGLIFAKEITKDVIMINDEEKIN